MSLSTALSIAVGTTPCSQVVAGGGGAGGAAWDFTDAEVGQAAPGTSTVINLGGAATALVAAVASSVSGKGIQVSRSSGNAQVVTTLTDVLGGIEEGEVLAIMRVDGAFASLGIGIVNQDGGDPPNGPVMYLYNGQGALGRFADASSVFSTAYTGTTFNPGLGTYTTGMRIAFRMNLEYTVATEARRFRGKMWDFDGAEPGAWQIDDAEVAGTADITGPFDDLLLLAHLQGGAFGAEAILEWADFSADPDVSVEAPA